jgi:hypothetical protein
LFFNSKNVKYINNFLFSVAISYSQETIAKITNDLKYNLQQFNISDYTFQIQMKFDDPRIIYSRTAAQQLATTDETYLDIAIYSRSNIPDYQLVYIPMSFQNCYYNTFSDQFSKVIFLTFFYFFIY